MPVCSFWKLCLELGLRRSCAEARNVLVVNRKCQLIPSFRPVTIRETGENLSQW